MVLLIAIGLSIASAAQVPAKRHPKRNAPKVVAPAPPPVVEQAPAPEPPKFPADLPAVAPKVAFYNGMLSIDAPNSNLGDVLKEVKRLTGVAIEGGNVSDRIVARLGPGNPNVVLTQLLDGSRFDYIILGSLGNPNEVQRLVLMARAGEPGPAAAAQPTGMPTGMPQAPRANGTQPQPPIADTEGTEEAAEEPEQPEEVPANEGVPGMPGQPNPNQPQVQPNPNLPQGAGGVPQGYPQPQPAPDQQPKTPEQMYLDQINRLRQQQQNQQNQPPPPQP